MSNTNKCYPKKVDNLIIQRIKEGISYVEILKELKNKNWYESNYNSFKSYTWELKKKTGLIEQPKTIKDTDKKLLKFLDNKKSIKVDELSKQLSMGKRDLERSIQRYSAYSRAHALSSGSSRIVVATFRGFLMRVIVFIEL